MQHGRIYRWLALVTLIWGCESTDPGSELPKEVCPLDSRPSLSGQVLEFKENNLLWINVWIDIFLEVHGAHEMMRTFGSEPAFQLSLCSAAEKSTFFHLFIASDFEEAAMRTIISFLPDFNFSS